jgi:hypothetical protein
MRDELRKTAKENAVQSVTHLERDWRVCAKILKLRL